VRGWSAPPFTCSTRRGSFSSTTGSTPARASSQASANPVALREHFLDGLRRRDPVTGHNDHPEIGAFYRLILDTPDLIARHERFRSTGERALSQALQETAGLADVTARLAAAQVIAVQWTLARDNIARLAAGQTADDRYPAAVQDAEHAYTLLHAGLGTLPPMR
jgi:hypothetical protein